MVKKTRWGKPVKEHVEVKDTNILVNSVDDVHAAKKPCTDTTAEMTHFSTVTNWKPAANAKVLGFYGHKEGKQYAEFSNFFPHAFAFTLPSYCQKPGFPADVEVQFSEAAIMLSKAALMGDLDTFHQIMKASTPGKAKQLGRQVKPWDEALWITHIEETAFHVVSQKFESSPRLRGVLLGTGNKHLAEMTANDQMWGTGVHLGTPEASDPSKWEGRNVLGNALMQARTFIREKILMSANNEGV
eukprot:GEMP01056942.1.p1 GENE.GEMP01056942.1~~GEMP01056942.1.p1  ORF type:complete len:261 (+),score=44.99 GEMP01056942.1:56-784(+)